MRSLPLCFSLRMFPFSPFSRRQVTAGEWRFGDGTAVDNQQDRPISRRRELRRTVHSKPTSCKAGGYLVGEFL